MRVEVHVAAPLQRLLGGARRVNADGGRILNLLENLERDYPGFKSQVVTPEGDLRPFVNVYLNDEDIRFLDSLNTPLHDGDVVAIMPAIAGGSR